MKFTLFKNKKILILGFGREGFSSLKFLSRMNRDKNFITNKITVADKQTLTQLDAEYKKFLAKNKNIKLKLGKNYMRDMDKYDVIIKTSGIKLADKVVKMLKSNGVEITTNLNLFLSQIKGKVIGVTGTKGKSTTASLLYEILRAAGKTVVLVGNIGKPFLDYLNKDSRQTIFVAELSSYQLDTLRGKVEIGVITSFFPEHLNYHNGVRKYFEAKMNLARASKVFIFNQNLARVRKFVIANHIRYKTYRTDKTNRDYKIGRSDKTDRSRTYKTYDAKLAGEHNQSNISAAIAVAELYKIKRSLILKVIKNFKGLEHRLELVGKFKGITFYNDVLSTTPESTIAAIETLQDKNLATIIVGGFDRGLNYKKLARKIIQTKICNIIYWPNTGETVAREIKTFINSLSSIKDKRRQERVKNLNLIKVQNMKQTVLQSFKLTNPGETVLLSPAASSYDFYQDYREKGKEFKEKILNLKN